MRTSPKMMAAVEAGSGFGLGFLGILITEHRTNALL